MIQYVHRGTQVSIQEPEAVQMILHWLDDNGLDRISYSRCLDYFRDIHDAVQVAPIIPIYGVKLILT